MDFQLNPETYTKVIDKMLRNKSYNYARETLVGIKENIEEKNRVTKDQIKAINNIRRGADRLYSGA